MESLLIAETKKTPLIRFSFADGKLEISGLRSMPEMGADFYLPALNWVNEYIKKPVADKTLISFKLDYFNTSSSRSFVELLKRLDSLAAHGHPVNLHWYYEEDDEDMYAIADDICASIQNISIEKISY